MKRNQIMKLLKEYQHINRFINNIYEELVYCKKYKVDAYNEFMDELEKQNLKYIVELIMYLEG